MTGTTESTAETTEGASKGTQINTLLNSSDWEQRVEAARARREHVLAEKRRAAEAAPAPIPPPAPAPEPAPEIEAPAPKPPHQSFARTPPPLTAPKTDKPVLRAVRHPATAPGYHRPRPRARLARARISGRAALLAVACCVALGFGLSFGFGTALSMNSFSVTESPDPVTLAPAPVVTSETAEPEATEQTAAPAVPAPDTPPPAAPEPSALPDKAAETATPRIHVYAPDSVPTATIDQRTARLDQSGYEIADVQRLSLTISAPHVRYYDVTDASIARTIAQHLQIEARDFSQSGNGAPGRLEVWLDGTTNRRSARTGQNPVDELIRLGNRVLRSLQ